MKRFDLSLYVRYIANKPLFIKIKSVKTNSSRYSEEQLKDMYVYDSVLINNKTNKAVAISEDDNGDLEYIDIMTIEELERTANIKLDRNTERK